ncbi:MAG: M28 family peptidase [Planctomycetota bacterium]|nr:M28 family peptidase [Planctomycetota bacterium]
MIVNRMRGHFRWTAVLLLLSVVVGCLGSAESIQGDNSLSTLRQQVILTLTRQGRLTAEVRQQIFKADSYQALQTLISGLDTDYLKQIPVDGKLCMDKLEELVALGGRVSGSPGMEKQRTILTKYFQSHGGRILTQTFQARNPIASAPVETVKMTNLIVQWHPERKKRVLICAHYDTRPFPDNDPDRSKRKGLFVGANDGASGVAVLCGLAPHMKKLSGTHGVDFVLFDGEELVYDSQRDPFFLGSTHFAREYVAQAPPHRYVSGILLDMVGDADLQIYQEINSRKHAPQVVQQVWATARRLGVQEFHSQARHEVRDDHLPLNEIARIPTIDIIDFDYPSPRRRETYWHTTQDTADKCSPVSLAHVGWVTLEWLKSLR